MKKIYTPYTYLIGWSKLDKWYYGSRYSTKHKCLYETGCHPKDLWEKYHTSSKIVTAFREEHGEPDVREIRKTFSNADDAKAWEHRILQRMNVVKNDKWLNDNDKLGPPLMTGEKHPRYGRKHTEETLKKNPMYGRTGEKCPNYGKTGNKNPASKKIKVTYLGIEKTYPCVRGASKDLDICWNILAKIARGIQKTSTKYPSLRAEYI